jgi:glutathione peroxidase
MQTRTTILMMAAAMAVAAVAFTAQPATKSEATHTGEKTAMSTIDYLHIPFSTITGDTTNLNAFKGKVVLVVNVASKCGYTPQYAGLETLYRAKKDKGLVIIGFPANNFKEQEPGTNEEIMKFCQTTYDVTFPMMAKISVKGTDIHPLYAYLTKMSNLPGEIGWNFNKFLFDREGKLVARYDSPTKPDDPKMVAQIDSLLAAK